MSHPRLGKGKPFVTVLNQSQPIRRFFWQKLTSGEWIERHQDLLVTGPTGTGNMAHVVSRGE